MHLIYLYLYTITKEWSEIKLQNHHVFFKIPKLIGSPSHGIVPGIGKKVGSVSDIFLTL